MGLGGRRRNSGRRGAIDGPSIKISVWLAVTDWQFLRAKYPHNASDVVRRLIANHRHEIESRERTEEEWQFDLANL